MAVLLIVLWYYDCITTFVFLGGIGSFHCFDIYTKVLYDPSQPYAKKILDFLRVPFNSVSLISLKMVPVLRTTFVFLGDCVIRCFDIYNKVFYDPSRPYAKNILYACPLNLSL